MLLVGWILDEDRIASQATKGQRYHASVNPGIEKKA
jgi:hypothetical protein